MEKKVVELVVALKNCQDEKKAAEEALDRSKKIWKNYRRHMMMICG
jgi:hypothetical protein